MIDATNLLHKLRAAYNRLPNPPEELLMDEDTLQLYRNLISPIQPRVLAFKGVPIRLSDAVVGAMFLEEPVS